MTDYDHTALVEFIDSVERSMFRTDMDTGANPNALIIWNRVREYAGLPTLARMDLTRRHLATAVDDLVRLLATPQGTAEQHAEAVSRKQEDIRDLAQCVAEGVPMAVKVRQAKKEILGGL